METFQIRTDLALEARESVNEEESRLRGVSVEEHYEEETDIRTTKVTIDTKNAEKTLGKPMGVYVTMEAPAMVEPDDDYHREISEALAEELLKMLPQEQEELAVLIVGLGNREVTADALGPQVVDNLLITRHVVRAYGKAAYNCTRMNLVSSIEPGVMAKTGMETAEIIGGVVKETEPDVLIAVDALAARSIKRLNRTIQITNTGIQPGSGVGNHRNALTKETLGVPVIAIGIPTVVDAATIVGDALEKLMNGETEPDVLIAVDALAARSIKRLNRTIQITNTGIQPGSGVGNHRNALTKETLGVPVIAIGIPTVVDAATIVGDALEKLMNGEKEFDAVKYMGQHRMAFAELNNMYMTGKDIDSVIKRVSYTVSEGINIAMEKNWV